MTPRKLSATDKQDILDLYRQPQHTTLTLADRYGVSNSTISRLLKSSLSSEEYEALIQQKRSSRGGSGSAPKTTRKRKTSAPETTPETASESAAETAGAAAEPQATPAPSKSRSRKSSSRSSKSDRDAGGESKNRRRRKRSRSNRKDKEEAKGGDRAQQLTLDGTADSESAAPAKGGDRNGKRQSGNESPAKKESKGRSGADGEVEILPLSQATLPKTCYLVVDRAAELIVRPLKEFAEGSMPSTEVSQKALPIFDNHRVARRFSNRSQRVIKIPDGTLLQRTGPHLQAKGITRLFVDGQIYDVDG